MEGQFENWGWCVPGCDGELDRKTLEEDRSVGSSSLSQPLHDCHDSFDSYPENNSRAGTYSIQYKYCERFWETERKLQINVTAKNFAPIYST